LFKDEFWFVVPENDPAAREKEVAIRKLDPQDVLLMEEGHCLRSHAIAACGPRRGGWAPKLEATSLYTLIQMVEGGMGVTLLPEITLKGGILKGTRLVARPFAVPAPSRTLALVARSTSPRLGEMKLLADFIVEHHRRGARPGIPALRRSPQGTKA
jgi:LysR family hydrogen peroxide-inducible transcriptional activator